MIVLARVHFAAELLLPEAALSRLSEGRRDGASEPAKFKQILVRYGVGAQTAAYQLHNRGWLSSKSVCNDLIGEFGRDEPSVEG